MNKGWRDIDRAELERHEGELRREFQRLSDQDIQQIQADPNQAPDILKTRYGYSEEECQRRLDAFAASRATESGR